jgi:predicted Zn-dependent peptidase
MPKLGMRLRLLPALIFLLFNLALGQSLQLEVKEHKLDNGLTILTLEDHSAPIVSYQVWFKVGSRNERPGITGVSHLFEHMMFKGSKNIAPEEHAKLVQANGGVLNAWTSNDNTTYYDNLPSDKLELAIRLEAERQSNLNITAENLASEREVVKEERRLSTDNSPFGAVIEQLYAAAYTAHPYHWPVLGWMSDIDAIVLEDCQSYFKTHYAPSNATVVIVGDFKTDQAVALVKKYYGGMKSQPPGPPVKTVEPPQMGERRVTVHKIAQTPMFFAGYHIPNINHEDIIHLKVLAKILFQGQSSRTYQSLIYDKQIAINVGGGVDEQIDPGLFYVYATAKPGVTAEQVEKELYAELDRIAAETVTDRELEKAKNQLESEFYNGLQSVSSKASQVGYYQTIAGDYRKFFNQGVRIQKVTKEDLLRVAETYLTEKNRTVAILVPEKPRAES